MVQRPCGLDLGNVSRVTPVVIRVPGREVDAVGCIRDGGHRVGRVDRHGHGLDPRADQDRGDREYPAPYLPHDGPQLRNFYPCLDLSPKAVFRVMPLKKNGRFPVRRPISPALSYPLRGLFPFIGHLKSKPILAPVQWMTAILERWRAMTAKPSSIC